MPFIKKLSLISLFAFLYIEDAKSSSSCSPGASNNPVECLACNCYYETRGESTAGQIAVAQVVRNRVGAKGFAHNGSVCGIIYAKSQFSWTNMATKRYYTVRDKRGRKKRMRSSGSINGIPSTHECYSVARKVLNSNKSGFINADHFFNPRIVRPRWASKCKHVQTIQNHAFYNCYRKNHRGSSSNGARGSI